MKAHFNLLFFAIAFNLFALKPSIHAQTGEIQGAVTDAETGETMPFVNVSINVNGNLIGTSTDFDGIYSLNSLRPGLYDVTFSYVAFQTKKIEQVQVNADKTTFLDVQLSVGTEILDAIEVVEYRVPLMEADRTTTGSVVTSEEIRSMPTRDVSSIAGKAAGVYSGSDSGEFLIRGSASGGDGRYVEGVKVEEPEIQSGLLTAGEINDFGKWNLWQDLTKQTLKEYQNQWNFFPSNRYALQVSTPSGKPVINAKVSLLNAKNTILWQAKTDNTGKAELWLQLFGDSPNITPNKLKIKVTYDDKEQILKNPSPFAEGLNFVTIDANCHQLQQADILFVVDATSSMSDEIKYLKAELKSVVSEVQTQRTNLNIRLGSVFYRDHGDEYVTKKSGFSAQIDQTIEFLQNNRAGGGGDYEEAVEEALQVGIEKMQWSEDAVARLLFLVLDAPPHPTKEIIARLQKLTAKAAEKGIRIIPIGASGLNKSTEYLMRSLALATNGTYTFLTDHSGIGGSHIEPSTDDYDMEFLNDLLVRLIDQYTQIPDCEENTKLLSAAKSSPISEEVLSQLNFYPNPVANELTVHIKSKLSSLFITDLSGKILQRLEDLEQGEVKVDMSRHPSGIYFVRYTNEDGKESSAKLVVAH
ncbi:MAG: carboxypeptidase regulatory-like domain-containing protein [Chitinophagales bacterium]